MAVGVSSGWAREARGAAVSPRCKRNRSQVFWDQPWSRLSTLLLHCLELQTGVAAVVQAEQQQHWRARILIGQNQVIDGDLFVHFDVDLDFVKSRWTFIPVVARVGL